MAEQLDNTIAGSGISDKFERWRRRHVSDTLYLFLLVSIVGLLSGCGAYILKYMIGHVSAFLTSHFRTDGFNPVLLVLPLVGIVLTGIFCRYIIKTKLSDGESRLMSRLRQKRFREKFTLTYAPLIASTITLGFGGSAGSEGPIASAGAAIGSNIGKAFRLSKQQMMVIVGCGAGAGIAGIFKSPLGGALFTLEVLKMPLTTITVLALLVTVIIAAMTAYVLSGFTIDIPFDQTVPFDTSLIPFVLLLGVFCGLYSVYYSYIMATLGARLKQIKNQWLKNIIAGCILSGLLFLFPALYGEGYGVVGKVLNGSTEAMIAGSPLLYIGQGGWSMIIVAAGILLMKCFATSATNYGGGVSGDFAPTLFAGCIAGFLFAALLNNVFGLALPESHFAYFAMAGVMAGAVRAPLMAMFLTCEMCGAYSFFLPLMLTAAISYGVVRLCDRVIK